MCGAFVLLTLCGRSVAAGTHPGPWPVTPNGSHPPYQHVASRISGCFRSLSSCRLSLPLFVAFTLVVCTL